MKVACQVCDRMINTDGELKGNYAYGFSVSIETEPYINSAVARRKEGYLCFDCQNRLSNLLKYNRR